MTIIVAPATHVVLYNITHLIHHNAKFQLYHITSCKNKLDASNMIARLRGSMVTLQTTFTYVAIEHDIHDCFLTFGVG